MVDLARPQGTANGYLISEHAADMARQRGVVLAELGRVLANRSYVLNNSKKDPESDRYVMRFKDLRIVWNWRGDDIQVLTIFHQ